MAPEGRVDLTRLIIPTDLSRLMTLFEPGGHVDLTKLIAMDSALLELHGRKRLIVCIYAEFFPVAFFDKKAGRFAGFDVDLIEAFSALAGLKPPKYVRIDDFFDAWEKPGRWSDRVDVAIGGIGRANYRESPTVEWSIPYFEVRRTVIFRLADPVRRFPQDVTGVIVGTMGSTGMNDAVDLLRAQFGKKAFDHIQARYKTTDEADLKDLLDGKIQGVMRGSFVGKAIVAEHPETLGMAEPWDASPRSLKPYGREVFAFPCRRGSGLAALLNLFMILSARNGDLAKLAEKHAMV